MKFQLPKDYKDLKIEGDDPPVELSPFETLLVRIRVGDMFYGWIELETEWTEQTKIPEGVHWSQKEDGSQKNVIEYVTKSKCVFSIDGSKVIVPLCASEDAFGRTRPITETDIHDWYAHYNFLGVDVGDIMSTEQKNNLLQTKKYTGV